MSPTERRPLKGTLSWTDAKNMHITVGVDRLAIGGGHLCLLSCVGYVNEIKALRAALAIGVQSSMSLGGRDTYAIEARKGETKVAINQAFCLPGHKYRGESHRLGFNVLHATFVANQPGLMLEDTDEALWAQLKDPRYTTPLLRSWLPHLRRELAAGGFLHHLECVDCTCMRLTALTKDLDEIVEHGLRNNSIAISEEQVA